MSNSSWLAQKDIIGTPVLNVRVYDGDAIDHASAASSHWWPCTLKPRSENENTPHYCHSSWNFRILRTEKTAE
jgi:hypothetical protein